MNPKTKFFIAIIITILAGIICLIVFWPSADKTGHVKLQGYVHDHATGKPINNCKIVIFNCIIQEDNTYGRDKTLYTTTDVDGHYEAEMENSHLMYIRVFKKGYSITRSGAVKSERETEQNFILEKGNDSESDLYKQNEVEEIIQ